MLWLCLRFNELPLAIYSNYNEQPIAVVEKDRIVCANQLASEQGVDAGQRSSQALSLAPELLLLKRQTNKEKDLLYLLALSCYDISPYIHYKENSALLLEVSRCLKLFKGLQNILHLLEQRLSARALDVSLGLAHSQEAAWLLSWHTQNDLKAIYCFKRQTLDEAALKQALLTIPLSLLKLDKKTRTQLQHIGFTCLADCHKVPHFELGKRFGKDFVDYLKRIFGEVQEQAVHLPVKPIFDHSFEHVDGLTTVKQTEYPINNLLNDFCHYLNSRQLSCLKFTWQFSFQDHEDLQLAIDLVNPQVNQQTFFYLSSLKLESLLIPSPITRIKLYADQFSPLKATSVDLFEDGNDEGDHLFDEFELLDNLLNRLGKETCYVLKSTHEQSPEKALQLCSPHQEVKQQKSSKSLAYPMLRPLWLLEKPIRILQRDKHLYWRGQITLISSVEKFNCQWWEIDCQRNYYIGQSTEHCYYWIYQDLHDNNWYIHGRYA